MELLGPNPGRHIPVFFLMAIAVGAALLSLPVSCQDGRLAIVDAVFTATSAVCITGLIVVDTAHDLSRFGQIVVLVLIQVGGLGFMTLTSVVLFSLGTRLTFREKLSVDQSLNIGISGDIAGLIKAVVMTTFLFELCGAVALLFRFWGEFSFGEACFHAVFHSVSAFCNAGFSTFSNSLENYRFDNVTILIFSALIIFGGLGFVVISDIFNRFRNRNRPLTLHSKLCLTMTAILLVAGTIAFLVAENKNFFQGAPTISNLSNAFFQAVTSRTAGFNTIPQASLAEISILITMILMFIGACPGSTAGGIKTTTFAIIAIMVYRRFTGYKNVSVFKRTISNDSVSRALTVFILAIIVILVVFVTFMYSEQTPASHKLSHGWFVENLFEVISAFGTVGLSMGVTPHLHDIGKLLIVVTMFIGRVGLLTLAFALARPSQRGEVIYREEEVMVG
ncbi:MAG: TrkH family potassium uptake protein [Candidatus Zixiibacteriota bacterium]